MMRRGVVDRARRFRLLLNNRLTFKTFSCCLRLRLSQINGKVFFNLLNGKVLISVLNMSFELFDFLKPTVRRILLLRIECIVVRSRCETQSIFNFLNAQLFSNHPFRIFTSVTFGFLRFNEPRRSTSAVALTS